METGFVKQIMLFLVMKKRQQKDLHQTTLQSKGSTRKGIKKINISVRGYVYLVLTFQVWARSSIICNSTPAVDAQKVFKSMFKELINKDYSVGIDTERYQGVLEHALSKLDFSVGIGI